MKTYTDLAWRAAAAILSACVPILAAAQDDEDPQARAQYEAEAWRNASGVIDVTAVRSALDQRRTMLSGKSTASLATQGASSGAVWTELGPSDIGGRVRSVVVHPTTPSTLFAGTVGGGIWKSTNGGGAWTQVGEETAAYAITSVAIATSNPSIMYATTGEHVSDGINGTGVLKSVDGGNTWSVLPSSVPLSYGDPWTWTTKVWVDPTNPNLVLVAGYVAMMRSTDGGATWATVVPANVCDIASKPGDPNTVLAAACSSGIAFRSIDRGTTWTPITVLAGGGGVAVAWAPSDPATVYASVDAGGGEVFRSTDSGQHFSYMSTPGVLAPQGWWNNCIIVNPVNAQQVAVAGVLVARSVDGGATFDRANFFPHADFHSIAASTVTKGNPLLYFGNDGGVSSNDSFFTADYSNPATSGWHNLSNGLRVTQFYGVAVNKYNVIGGTQDNGTLLFTPNVADRAKWYEYLGGDGGHTLLSDQAGYEDYLFGEFQWFQPHRKRPGEQAGYITGGLPDSTNQSWFIAPLEMDDEAAVPRLYGGGHELWVLANSIETTPTWSELAESQDHINAVSAISVSKIDRNVLWVAWGPEVYETNNATAASPTFTTLPGTPFGGVPYATSIHASVFDVNTAYVTFAGTVCCDRIWVTHNRGASWTPLPDQLPTAPVRDIIEDPADPQTLYVATDVGLFVSADAGSTWLPVAGGPGPVAVYRLAWTNQTLLVATHGRGMWAVGAPSADATFAFDGTAPAPLGSTNARVLFTDRNNLYTSSASATVNIAGPDLPVATTSDPNCTSVPPPPPPIAGWHVVSYSCHVVAAPRQSMTSTFRLFHNSAGYVIMVGATGPMNPPDPNTADNSFLVTVGT